MINICALARLSCGTLYPDQQISIMNSNFGIIGARWQFFTFKLIGCSVLFTISQPPQFVID